MHDDYSDVRIGLGAPWVPIPVEDRPRFANELTAELSPGHPLFGRATIPIVGCSVCDDVVFMAESDDGFYTRVHLTWRGTSEVLPYPEFEWANPPLSAELAGH
jgi:hypothetical protein